MYGVFRSSSQGGWNLEPTAWEGHFPAQIYVQDIRETPRPGEGIPYHAFSHAIAENFFTQNHFSYSLTAAQVHRLSALFDERLRFQTVPPAVTSSPGRRGGRGGRRGGRGIMKPHATPRRQPRQRQPRVLELLPGQSPPVPNESRRYFGGYSGYRVIVSNQHPMTHCCPPDQDRLSSVSTGMLSEDGMDCEFVGSVSPMEDMSHAAQPSSPFHPKHPGRMLTPPVETSPVFAQTAVLMNQPQNMAAVPKARQVKRKAPEEQWMLGEVTWPSMQEFLKFICGNDRLPTNRIDPSPVSDALPAQESQKLSRTMQQNATVEHASEVKQMPLNSNKTRV